MEPLDDPAREAWRLLFRLFRTQRRNFAAMHAEFDLNPAQVHLLLNLEAETGSPMSELAEALACDASYVTNVVDKLEVRDLVRRMPKPDDRRVKLVALTQAGRDVAARLKDRFATPPPFIASMPAEDQVALRDIFQRAVAKLEAAEPASGKDGG